MSMVQTFSALEAFPKIRHAFVQRVREVDVVTDRDEAIRRLQPTHAEILRRIGFYQVRHAEQVHGNVVEVVTSSSPQPSNGADGLITAEPGLALCIYVADCAAVYLVDKHARCLGLVHSGRRGSELGIAGVALRRMQADFGVDPADVVIQVSPCIRPPLYEVDFAALIRDNCLAHGVLPQNYHDCGACTGSDLGTHYSYRMEKGFTGRMAAYLGLIS